MLYNSLAKYIYFQVTQLSVLVDINDLGNSVHRFVSRMFSDFLLSELFQLF